MAGHVRHRRLRVPRRARSRRAGRAPSRMRDVLAHRGPDEAGLLRRRPAPSLAHRRLSIVDLSGRPAAAVERGRQRVGRRSTARSTTTPSSGRELEAHGHRYRTQVRHRDDRARLRAVGRRLRAPLPRHVRVRASGTRRSAGCCSSAIASASSRSTGRCAGDTLLFASEIKAILASGLVDAAANEAVLPEVLSTRYIVGRRRRCSAASTSCCRDTCSCSRTARSRCGSTGTCRRAPAQARPATPRRRRRRAVPRAARGVGPPAADERRAARHVPVRRHRQQRDRGADGAR